MNVAIYGKKSDKIGRFFRNVTGETLPNGHVKISLENGGSVTIKPTHFNIIWTLENDKPETAKDAIPAPEVGGVPVSSESDIDRISVEKIKAKYPKDAECKILRQAVAKIATVADIDLGGEFGKYNTEIESIVLAGKTSKAKHFKRG